jgi:penicillin-binding protein 2
MTISRDYPFNDIYTHVLGYVSQPNEEDILANEVIQEKVCSRNKNWKS